MFRGNQKRPEEEEGRGSRARRYRGEGTENGKRSDVFLLKTVFSTGKNTKTVAIPNLSC